MSRMRENRTYGICAGTTSNGRPYSIYGNNPKYAKTTHPLKLKCVVFLFYRSSARRDVADPPAVTACASEASL